MFFADLSILGVYFSAILHTIPDGNRLMCNIPETEHGYRKSAVAYVVFFVYCLLRSWPDVSSRLDLGTKGDCAE